MATYVEILDAEVAPEAPVTTSLMTRLRDNALAYAGAPTGTRASWQQTAAPLGWTKDTTHNNKAVRLVSGTASTGGSVAFTTAFGRTATDGFSLTVTHNGPHTHAAGTLVFADVLPTSSAEPTGAGPGVFTVMTSSTSLTKSVTGSTASQGSGTAHAHDIDLRVAYVDFIIAEKA